MLAGGAAGRGVAAIPRVAPWVAGAVGEGVVSAGASAEGIRQQSETGTLTPRQAVLAATSGAATSALGAVGGRVAQRLGIADLETLLVTGAPNPAARRGLARAVVAGAIEEGALEELPQSVQEQVAQNVATGRAWDQDLDDAAVLGTLAGAVMGGAAQGAARPRGGRAAPSTAAAAPPSPPATPVSAAPAAPTAPSPSATSAPQPQPPGAPAPTSEAAPAPKTPEIRVPVTDLAVTAEEPIGTAPDTPAQDEHAREYSSTQVNLPPDTAKAVTDLAARIPDAALAADGREMTPHVTVKYGLHADNAAAVRELLAKEPPITLTLGATSLFENDDADVVKIDVDSKGLRRLNAKIAKALPHSDTHPTYVPHVTVAYVKPGQGKQYAGDESLKGRQVTIDRVVFSAKDGTVTVIPLRGAPATAAPAPEPVGAPVQPAAAGPTPPSSARPVATPAPATPAGQGTEGDRAIAPATAPAPVSVTSAAPEARPATTPVATLTGEEIGTGLTDIKAIRKAGIAYYTRELQHGLKQVERPGFGVVRFTKKGRQRVKWYSADPTKLRVLPAVAAVIQRGAYLGRQELYKTRHDGIVAFHRFLGSVALGDRTVDVRVIVGEDDRGNLFFDLDAVQEETQAYQLGQEPGPGSVSGGLTATQGQDSTPDRAEEQARDRATDEGETAETEVAQSGVLDRIQSLEDAARERLKKRGTFSGTRASSGLPVDDIADLVVIGAAKIAKGAVGFGQWSAEMVREFGAVIRPHLRAIFDQAKVRAEAFGPLPIYAPGGRELPPTQSIPTARILEFPSLQKMPQPIRADLANLMQEYQGFESQRRGVQTWERTRERAKDVWLPLETLKPGRALNAEELEAYKTAIATALSRRKPLLERIRDGNATDWDRLQASHLTDVATILTASYRGAKAEAGRALNILRAKARVLDLQESRFLEAALKAPGFQADLTRVSKAALEAAGDPLAQLRILRQRSGTLFDYLQAAYYTSLLSGIKTQLRNIIGNSFNLVANTLVPIGAVPVDAVRARRRGRDRNVYIGEMTHAVAGAWVGLGRGARNALFVLRYGFRPSTVQAAGEGKFDAPRVELPGGLVTNFPTRLLEGMDEFFRAVAKHQELYAGAYAQARREGLTGAQAIADRMATLLSATDPTTADGKLAGTIIRRADTFAARAVFQEDPGPIVQWLLKAKSPGSPTPLRMASMIVAPFVKTPSAILRQGGEWSPVGFVMRGIREGDDRQQSQALGRAVLGSGGLLLSVAWLAANGLLTGAPPDDPGEREEFFALGKMANAVKIGPFWVRYSLFQPFSVGLAAVANAWSAFEQSEKDDAAAEEAFVTAVAGAGASLLDQSFLGGLGTLIDAVQDPQRSAGRWLSLFVQGLVPFSGLMRNITQAVDPVVRKPSGVGQSVKAIVPGLSDDLLPRRNRFGEPVTRPGSWLQRGFLVPEISRAADDELTLTLERLGIRPTVPQARFTVNGKRVEFTQTQRDVVVEATGRERKVALEVLLRRTDFRARQEDQQRVILKRELDAAGERVRARTLAAMRAQQELTVWRLVSERVRYEMARERREFQWLVSGRQ